MSGLHLHRRGILAGLGLAAVPVPALAPSYVEGPDDRLAACLGRLWLAEGDVDRLSDDYEDAEIDAILTRMDAILTDAAFIKPETARGWGYKARIVQVYGDSKAGELVRRYLLAELIERGGVRV